MRLSSPEEQVSRACAVQGRSAAALEGQVDLQPHSPSFLFRPAADGGMHWQQDLGVVSGGGGGSSSCVVPPPPPDGSVCSRPKQTLPGDRMSLPYAGYLHKWIKNEYAHMRT
jgi:hypothetical protein